MKLLITGAGGFLGSRLAEFYRDKYEVYAPVHREFDFTDREQVRRAFEAFGPDIVVHAGAISDLGTCQDDPELSMTVNVKGTENLAVCCARYGARLLFCSSDQVYFRKKKDGESCEEYLRPNREEDGLAPLPVYGRHKLLAETVCLREQPDSVLLRLSWMYGDLTDHERSKGRKNLGTILAEAVRSRRRVSFLDSDRRSVTDVSEVVAHMEAAFGLPPGVYNFGSKNGGSMYDTVRRVLLKQGMEELLAPAENGELRNLTMDLEKTETAGIHFKDTAEGLEDWLKRRI